MSVPILRPAGPSHIERLCQLEQESFRSDRIARRSWRALVASPSARVVVAELGELLLGCAVLLLRRGSRVARLYSVAVSRRCREQGIGHLLLTEACRLAQCAGCNQIRLESRLDNAQAHALFLSHGFVRRGAAIERYYEDGMSALRFFLMLPSKVPPPPAQPVTCN